MGLLRFWVILFGLWNAPTTFQRNGKSTEGPNRTEEEPLECLKGVLSRLQSVELNIKHEKWQLMLSAKLLLVRRRQAVQKWYVRNFADVAIALHVFIKKDVKWRWGLKEEEAFTCLRDALSNAASTRGRRPTSGDRVRLTLTFTGCSGLLRDANEDASPSLGYSPLLMISVRQEAKRPENPEDHPQLSNDGHLGVAKAVSRLSHRYYWPQQKEDVED
ncbi:hypothetical protein T4B_4567 [Trichinella pseudospiralis]|uniref:Integrase zinc-binding domain-containing protein n=1 Tax=Trichinella pseudospiralis TaxID=6337 RepID=A0A0V1H6H4_TRIPS|nr:hypothetical protein T4B_4567 [Trichinella pseudospiralis]